MPPAPINPVGSALPRPPKKPRNWRKIILASSFSALFLLFIGAAWLIFEAVSNSGSNQPIHSEVASTSIPLSDFAGSGSLNLLGTQSLAVNGQLRANESFVLAPQAQPTKSERGQLYFDSGTNRLAYYNGTQFVQIPGEEEADQASVLTLQGQSGNITLVGGSGVAVDGTTLTNTGVTSLAGLTGDITLGSGLNVVNGSITNSGLVGAAGGSGISVTNDGNGNITISNVGAGSGTVNSPNGTAGRIAKFTGVQTIEDSLLSEAGATVTVNGNLNVTGTTTLTTALGVNSGGTGATTLAANGVVIGNGSGALTAVTAGGIGECLLSTAGAPVFQACPGGGGGVTALNGLTGSLTIANATTAGSTITINDASTAQKGIAQFNSTNFSASGGVINTIQDIAIAATPTFGRLTLTSSQATSPMLLVNNTNGSGSGNLIDLQLSGVSRMAVSPAGNMTLTGTINGQTISSAASFTGTLAVAGAANLNGGATVTGTLNANTITPSAAMTVGATSQSLTLQGNASTTVSATNGGSTTTLSFQTPTANVNYRLLTASAGTYDICTTAANCAGVGGGVTTAGGTPNRVPKFTGAQTLGDSIISDNGSTVTIGGVLAVNTITPTGALTIGATSQALTLQGTTTTLSSTNAGVTNSLTFATPSGGNKTITVPNASGTVVVSASGPLAIDAAGNVTCATCAISGSGVTSLNGLTGALSLAYASGSGATVTIQDASTSQKGVAQFNSTNFSASSGTINTIQDISLAAAPQFGRLTLTSSQASNGMLLINNTNAGASGNLLDVQLNGSSRLTVNPAGAMTVAGTINGQTISSAANFTGTLAVAGLASLNAGATVTGTLTANTITPTSALTVGATNQSFLVQGNASSTITATSGANTTTVAFQTPTASVTYRLLTAAAGTYDICTTAGNCASAGGVTTVGGSTNRLAKFTGSSAIGDSIITDNGTTVTVGGTLAVNTITPGAAMTIGATSQNLTLQGADTTITETNGGFTNSLVFATPAGSNKTITLPNATGTVAVSASGPLAVDSNGNITCATCVTSGGGGGGVGAVDSLNGLTGALTIANASTAGSTITINDASTAQKGIAQFNSTNFSASSGVINTIQDISVAAAPTFGRLTVTSSQASSPMFLINNTNVGASGNLLDVQLNGSSRLAVTPAGAMTLTGTLNGQTISSAASFTGTLAVAGAANLNGGATVTGTLTANTITPTSSLTVGAANQSFLVQGSAASTIRATDSGNTTTLAFQTPTAAVTYRFLTAAAGTYDVCTTVGNCAGVGGGVTTAGGTTNQLAKFTGGQAIGDSIISDDGATVTIGGTLAVNTLTPTAALTIGATAEDLTMQGAAVNLTSTAGGFTNTLTFATPAGSNKTITVPNASGTLVVSASGPLAINSAGNISCATCAIAGSGVTSLNGLTGALSIANASATGSTITLDNASTAQKGIAQFNSSNFSASSGTINTIQDIGLAATPQFGRLTVTSSQASSAMFLVNNTNVGASGNLLDVQLNGASRLAVSPAGAMTLTGTLNGQTISSAANFTGTLAVAGLASLNAGATVTGTLTANTLTPTSSLTVGATNQSFLVQGSAASTITATNGANTTTLAFQSPTAAVTYRFLTAAAGTYDVCTTVGNCAGVAGGVTTAGGSTNRLAKFTGSQAIGDSIITDNGTTVTIGGTLAVNTLTPTAALTLGATSQNLTMQGASVNLTSTSGGFTNTLSFATPAGSSKAITVPNASGTLVVSASGPLAIDSAGNITCSTCAIAGSGVTSLNSLTGALTIANASTAGSTITINDATTAAKGIASFNSTNFSVTSGAVNTIQDISITSAPQFGRLQVGSGQASATMLIVNNSNASGSGNLIDLRLNSVSRMSVSPAGDMTLVGNVNGQTISSAANLTGTLAVAGLASLNAGATVTGTLTANTITPTGSLTVGATNQSFLVQGSSASTITATSGANKTTVAFQTPTANVTYRFLTAAAGTYDICTSAGNCGGVTTAGGTTNQLAKFTGSGSIGDSIISDNGSTVTIGGTLAVNTLTPTAALTVGATGQNLTMQGATVNLTSTSGGITNSLTFATPTSTNKTITIPDASGTLVVSASGPLAINAAGNITCATCVTASGAVTSLNGLTGALTIANASTGGSTITINDASTAQKGIAQFNSTNFSASSGTINTIQNINTTAAPQFGQLTLTSSQASAAMIVVNNTNVSASGNLLDLQLNGSSRLAVTPAGAMTIASTINGQTISSAASFTGTLAVASTANLNGGATVTGTLTANTITPTGALTVGATGQSFLVQGNASSTITATNSGNTTTLSFQTPTANVNYRLLTAAAGTYDICTSVGNCGGVTTSGGTPGKIAKFTGANTLGDSIMTESGAVISVAGTVSASTAVQTTLLDTASAAALNIGTTNATSINMNQNTIVAAGKTLTVTSGLTSLTGATVGDALNVSNSTSVGNIAVFKDNATDVLTIADGGNILAKNSVNSTTAFQVQNSQGKDVLSIDTDDASFNFGVDNAIANFGIDDNTTGWAVKGTATGLARETINKRTGRGALRVNTNAANDGAKYNVTLSNGQYYTATAYVQIGAGFSAVAANTITMGYSSNGTTDNTICDNLNFPKVTPNGYVKLTCHIIAPAPSGTPYFYVKQTDATARQLLIDDVLIVNDGLDGMTTPSTGGINLQGTVTSPLTLQNFSNSSSTFQILNNIGNSILNVGNDDDNLIEDGSFEQNELGWGGSNINDYGADPSISLFGSRSFRVGTNANTNAGVNYILTNSNNLALTPSTVYSMSWYARIPLGGTPLTDMKARYSYNGIAFTDCTPSMQSVADYGWTRLSCTFTTPASLPTASAAIHIVQTAATAHTFYLDGVRLEQGSTAKVYGNGTVSLDAVINSPVTIRNKYDTTNALTVQSFDGNTLFNVDTSNYYIEIGSTEQSQASTVSIATNITSEQWVSIGSSFGNSGIQLTAGAGDLLMYTNSASATVEVKTGTNNTQAFTVLNSSDVSLFTVDTSNSRVYIGNPTADTTGALLVLDTKTSAGDPTVTGSPTNLGAMYFNSSTQSFRCYANTTWRDCGGGRYVQSNQGNQSGNLPPAGDTVAGTTTPTTFSDVYSVPANDCVPGRTYRVTAGGLYTTSGAAQGFNIQLMWGSTTIANTDGGAAQSPGGAALTNENWYLQATVTCYTNFAGTISAEVRGIISMSASTAGPPQMGFLRNASTGQTITTASAQNLGVRMTWGNGTGDSITMRNFIVEAIGP